ncbi:MAG: FKBP-type peptidyl-prolyl cis-trans isomerase [Bacteriovoracia bacterium]
MLKTILVSIFCLAIMTPAFAKEKKAKGKGKAKAAVAKKEEKPEAKKEDKAAKGDKKRSDGLVIEDEKVGSGKEAKLGSKITVHYRGTLESGKEFDSSYAAGEPITFDLLEGRLIKGWTEGIPGMKVGGKRKLKIPYQLAYGETGTPGGPIPPKANLNFEVELMDVK